jgi:integrase
MNVSRIVSLHVQSDVSPDAEMISAKKRNRKLKKRSSGLYLVRSGGIYLFQIRLPKRIGGGAGSRPIRVSLGALPHQEARELADALAALARTVFREIEKRMAGYEGPDLAHIVSALADEDIPADDWPFEFATLILKGGLFDLREPARAPTSEEAKGLDMMRGLVRIGREVAAKQSGQPHDEMIADNADMLVARHIAKYDEMAGPVSIPEQLYSSTQIPVPPAQTAMPIAPSIKRSKKGPISRLETPAFKADRRTVERKPSTKPLFSQIASEYLTLRQSGKSGKSTDLDIAEFRLNMFVELIGDHPIDTYTPTDLQAFIDLMKYWPAKQKDRDSSLTPREIIAGNQDFHLETLALKTLQEGYVAVVKTVFGSRTTTYDYSNPIAGTKLVYPDSARDSVPTEPLSKKKVDLLLNTGVQSGLLDNAMLPLLGLLTGRRLGLLVHLQGIDFREKFEGVWVAQTGGIVYGDGVWRRVPYKTNASVSFFVLHNFLVEIGFPQWAKEQGNEFIFRELMRLADPSKSASSYMTRLMEEAGIKDVAQEKFHSLRAGYISASGDEGIEARDRKLQAGHELGADEHELYGFKTLTETKARQIAYMPLPDIDLTPYRGLNFDELAKAKRKRGRKSRG